METVVGDTGCFACQQDNFLILPETA